MSLTGSSNSKVKEKGKLYISITRNPVQVIPTHTQMNSEDTTAQPDNHISVTHTFGNHMELLDEDDDNDAAPSQVTGHGSPSYFSEKISYKRTRHLG